MEESIGLRIPTDLLERVDAELETMRQAHPGLRLTRSDIVRQLLLEALDQRSHVGGESAPSAAA
jgi:metal-responsive CopG/Arc/MetJ family transcriptional regulator